mmetsp:Transcript_2766/g.4122  ORF Transcript_2766/g.4122 Transcript_2766/m.4122 type:complete len:150 (+) Transcript_2766:83-532(+)
MFSWIPSKRVNASDLIPAYLTLVLLQLSRTKAAVHHTDLFPPDEEAYDSRILDPNTVYGSPYGGFARASRSRLAALPLVLPTDIGDNDSTEYVTAADGLGRRYACRTYHQDELTKSSFKASMFDQAELEGKSKEHDKLSAEESKGKKKD